MNNKIIYFLIILFSSVLFLLLIALDHKTNVDKKNRSKQWFLPIVSFVYCFIALCHFDSLGRLCLKMMDKTVETLGSRKLEFLKVIASFLKNAIDKYTVYAILIVFNLLFLFSFIILKSLIILIFIKLRKTTDTAHKIISLFYDYDEELNNWYLKEHYGQTRTFLCSAFFGVTFISLALMAASLFMCAKSLITAPFYPVFSIILIGEIFFFVNGLRGDEKETTLMFEGDESLHITNYAKLKKFLKNLFGDKLTSEKTEIPFEVESGDSIEEILQDIENSKDREGKIYAKFIRKKMDLGLRPNSDYVRTGFDLTIGKNILYNIPFYYKLIPYLPYAMQHALVKGGKILIVLGRHGTYDDLAEWCSKGFFDVSHIPDLWNIAELKEDNANDVIPDVGIISRSNVHNLNAHKNNSEFLKKVTFVILVEPSKLVTTAQIGLNLLINCFESQDVTYCSIDKNCDGLVDSLSHILKANITEVSATEHGRGDSSFMTWLADGEYVQHRIVPGISRTLGMGTELSFVALRNQVEEAVWYGGDLYPVIDQHWVAKQYYYDLTGYAKLPPIQESIDRYFKVSYNLCDQRPRDNVYVSVEDENNNTYEIKRIFSTLGEKQSFVNVISSEYMLREYMSENIDIFNTDSKAIPFFAADFVRSRRNAIINICFRLAVSGLKEDSLVKELKLAGFNKDDPRDILWKEINRFFNHTAQSSDDTISIYDNYNDENVMFTKQDVILRDDYYYDDDSGNFIVFYKISNERFKKLFLDDLQNANYIDESCAENCYLGSELKGQIFQKYLPGQFITINGKYYEIVSVAEDNRVILRRSADHILDRIKYRQVRTYKFSSIYDSADMGALKAVNGIDIFNQYADFTVETPAYWKLKQYNDPNSGEFTTINGIPERKYKNKQILKLDFSRLGDGFTDSVRISITTLMNELFSTLFAENQGYICALTNGAYDFPVTMQIEGLDPSDKAIYIVEDSQIDIGLIVAVERNLSRILNIISDYLLWNNEQIAESKRIEQEEKARKKKEEARRRKEEAKKRKLAAENQKNSQSLETADTTVQTTLGENNTDNNVAVDSVGEENDNQDIGLDDDNTNISDENDEISDNESESEAEKNITAEPVKKENFIKRLLRKLFGRNHTEKQNDVNDAVDSDAEDVESDIDETGIETEPGNDDETDNSIDGGIGAENGSDLKGD